MINSIIIYTSFTFHYLYKLYKDFNLEIFNKDDVRVYDVRVPVLNKKCKINKIPVFLNVK
jgi:hypothetical protein